MENEKTIEDTLGFLIGDVPVSEQLGAALERMALKEHEHSNYATQNEIADLKRKIEMLIDLVGDVPVSEQINKAIKLNKN
jgi:hypothetical protein